MKELADQGIDLVTTTLSTYTLGANVEDLAFSGSGKFCGIGNGLANHLTGGTGSDTLLGGSGNDFIRGGAGNDILYGENNNDVIEGGAGNDKLYGGANTDQLMGGDGDDYLSGMPGNDSLNGGAGQDTLLGGADKDCFVFDVTPIAANADKITDFSAPSDTIWLDHGVFGQAGPLGSLATGAFAAWQDAGDADDRILYDKSNGKLYYDPTGNQHDDAMLVATLTNLPADITASDFFIF